MTWREPPRAPWISAVVLAGAASMSACAKGDMVSDDHVALYKVPEASVRPDSGVAGKGSGGKGSGGSVGSGGTASGGATMGSGGSGAGGRAAGGSAENGGASMGGKASGGAGAMGGTSSGGRAAGGASTGGSGGTSSGGSAGKSTGGTMSGGSAGAGTGGGSGGAMACPNYPTNDDCSKCICSKCKSDVALCFASGDATKDAQCKAIQECAEMNHCAGTSCYCGTAFLCTPPNGACLQSINAAAGGNPTPTQVNTYAGDTTHPIGRANAIGTCSTNNCRTECGL